MSSSTKSDSWDAPHRGNPIVPGYYADASIVQANGKVYLYATLDPWGGETLGCWESNDFKDWTYRDLNWPTKAACQSADSGLALVWAPSVVAARDGRFYMYVSVGSEVWAGVAEHPLGPWRDLLGGGQPLIPKAWNRDYHMIDAEAFIDDDGIPYLYWGSGLNWVNGRCFAVKLRADMASFDGEVVDVTPTNYFEAPFMLKEGGKYYLMYSNGVTVADTYCVHYAVGDTPFGPFKEPPNSPILSTDQANHVVSPGHHTVFRREGRVYILYHRHSVPFIDKVLRQLCVDLLVVTEGGVIERVVATHLGPELVRGRREARSGNLAEGAVASASSTAGAGQVAARVLDGNYATRWAPAADAPGAWLQLDLRAVKKITRQYLRVEYAWKPHRLAVEASMDGLAWLVLADYRETPVSGSPLVIEAVAEARYLRLVFPEDVMGEMIAVFTWSVG